jgi:hypothetical protein
VEFGPAEIEQELAQQRERLLDSDYDEQAVATILARGREYYAETPRGFRQADTLSLFPEISGADELLYQCVTRFMIPPEHTAYASRLADLPNAVDVKTVSCRTQVDEKYCSLSVERALTLGDVEQYFFIDETLDADEGLDVASLYLAAMGSWSSLNRITRQGDDYLLQFGRRGCACSETRLARIRVEQGERRLEIDEPAGRTCV